MMDEEFEETNNTQSSAYFTSPPKGEHGKSKLRTTTPPGLTGVGSVALDGQKLSKNNDQCSPAAFKRLEEAYFLTTPESEAVFDAVNGKPPSPQRVSDIEDGEDVVDGGTSKTLATLQPVHSISNPVDGVNGSEEYETGADCSDHTGEQGWQSPASSQGSMKSADYLSQVTDSINRRVAQTKIKCGNLGNVLSKETYKSIQNYFADVHSLQRFLSFFKNDVMSTSFYTGACLPNSKEAIMQEQELGGRRKEVLGVIGKVLLDNYKLDQEWPENHFANTTTSYAQGNEMETEEADITTTIRLNEMETGIWPTIESFENEPSGNNTCTDVKVFSGLLAKATTPIIPTAKTSEDNLLPAVPNFSGATLPTKSKKRRNSVTVCQIPENVETETWENANDKLRENDSNKDKQIEKVGQVFFDAAFTKDEILTCSFSGKGKSSTYKPFDQCKIRFVRLAVAFMLSGPNKRSAKNFQKAVSKPTFKDLTQTEMATLKKKVFHEYAYRQRPKTKS